jgi:diguanylate cyclase (GGDEF)-like protein
MIIDTATINLAGALVAFASGLVLLMHWWQARKHRTAFVWGLANCGLGLGIALLSLRGIAPDWTSKLFAPLILNLSTAAMWAAARIFNRGSIPLYAPAAIVVLRVSARMALGATGHEHLAAASGVAIGACLYAGGAFEFWFARREPLRGRMPMIVIMGLESFAVFIAAREAALGAPLAGGAFVVLQLADLVYCGGGAIFLVTMLNDRDALKLQAAALTDPLTGLANRRAFTQFATRVLERNLRDKAPLSLLAFDLDRFKKINDTFGHPTGDHVLRIFADVVSRSIRPSDMAGRIGGEEFVLVLPGCRPDAALRIAQRIRGAFQNDARFVDGGLLEATVSVGVAAAPDHGSDLAGMIASADEALYRAKRAGRNRVVLALRKSSDSENVIRMA